MSSQQLPRRRKRRPMNGVKTVDVVRGKAGYGFTISGQHPCLLSCIVNGSPAETVGLKPGDLLLAVNGENVLRYSHDDVVRMIGTSTGTLTLQVAENVDSSDSSGDEYPQRNKVRHHARVRLRQSSATRVLKEQNHRQEISKPTSCGLNTKSTAKLGQPLGLPKRKALATKRFDQENKMDENGVEPLSKGKCHSYAGLQLDYSQNVGRIERLSKASSDSEFKNPSRNSRPASTNVFSRNNTTTSFPNSHVSFVDGDSETECTSGTDLHRIVGYIGSIEMPGDTNLQHARLQSFHSAVRRLRTEKNIHTLVLMTISEDGVKLSNTLGKVLAVYSTSKLAFCGVCPDDKRFFGIVTTALNDNGNDRDTDGLSGCSCHVFKIDLKLRSHSNHFQKAKAFGIECTRSLRMQKCLEFPQSAATIMRSICQLYKNKRGNEIEVPVIQVFSEPRSSLLQRMNSTSSSNSDSGLGFGKDEAVFMVDLPQFSSNSFAKPEQIPVLQQDPHLSPDVQTIPTPRSAFRQMMNVETKLLPKKDTLDQPKLDRLNVRVMPDPVPCQVKDLHGDQKNSVADSINYQAHSAVECAFQNGQEQAALVSHVRPVSAPFVQFKENFPVLEKTDPSSFNEKLSPRAILPSISLRSPSAPPLVSAAPNDFDFETNSRRPLEEILTMFENDKVVQEDATKEESRRFSECYALANQGETNHGGRALDFFRWAKLGSLRRQKDKKFKENFSYSHESLVSRDADKFFKKKLGPANSIYSILNHADGKDLHTASVSRVASWAVSFSRLLNDPAGVTIFTDFLKKEFSDENIVFWLAVEDYKKLPDGPARENMAKSIFNKHLSTMAPEPVNVDSSARENAQQNHYTPDMFDASQNHIFQLMKQDSYARFLKSNLYKSYLMKEMAGKPLNLPHMENGRDTEKKKGSKPKEEEKRRKSLLPWKQKTSKQNLKAAEAERQKLKKLSKDESRKRPSFVTMDLSMMRKEVMQGREISREVCYDLKFCRVTLPDTSTAVVCAKPGQKIRHVLRQLLDKRNLSLSAVDVILLGSEKPLDLEEDISTLGSKEVLVERRVLFQLDLPNMKSICVKARPGRTIHSVLKPVLSKYGYNIDSVSIQLNEEADFLVIQQAVSTIDNQNLKVVPKKNDTGIELKAGLGNNHRSTALRPPLPPKPKNNNPAVTLQEITNKVFEDLMHGKSESVHGFDELGVLDLDKSTASKKQLNAGDGDHHSLGTLGLLRKDSVGVKDQKQHNKGKKTMSSAAQKMANKRMAIAFEEEKFLDLLSKVQGDRLEEQRGVSPLMLDLPEFLRPTKPESSTPYTNGQSGLVKDYVCADNNKFSAYVRNSISAGSEDKEPQAQSLAGKKKKNHKDRVNHLKFGGDARKIRDFKTFGSPTDKVSVSFSSQQMSNTCDDGVGNVCSSPKSAPAPMASPEKVTPPEKPPRQMHAPASNLQVQPVGRVNSLTPPLPPQPENSCDFDCIQPANFTPPPPLTDTAETSTRPDPCLTFMAYEPMATSMPSQVDSTSRHELKLQTSQGTFPFSMNTVNEKITFV